MESSNVTAGEKKLDWDDIFNVFGDEFDRFGFPADVYRVTAGFGGEALLIVGSEKTALLDCGMAYCGSRMVEKLARRLAENGREKLDYIILSHSHYDQEKHQKCRDHSRLYGFPLDMGENERDAARDQSAE